MTRIGATVCVLMLLAVLPGCASLVGTGIADGRAQTDSRSTGEREMDVRITNRINAAFVSDPLIRALDIRVNSQRGIVTLQGTVANASVRSRALRIAESTREVRRVVDRLQVVAAP